MKVQKQHLQLAIAAVVVAVGTSIYTLSKPTVKPQPTAIPQQEDTGRMGGGGGPRGGPEPAQSVVQTMDPTQIPAPPPVGSTALSLASRDPFLYGNESRDVREAPVVSLTEAPVDPTMPVIKSILISSSRRLALVENKMLSVGQKIGEFTVVQIERDAVTFQLPSGERKKVALRTAEVSPAASAGVIR